MLISVIIPVYNRRELLSEALSSVQSCKKVPDTELEIIVVDDGSSDGSAELAESLGAVTIRTKHSGMPGKARNIGVEKAKGDIIAFLDSDDMWHEDKIVSQLPVLLAAERRDIPLVHTRERWLRKDREISQSSHRHKREGDIFCDALVKCIIGPSTVMMQKEAFVELGGFREDLEIAEDYELWLRLTDRYAVAYVDKPLTIKRAGDWEQLSEKYGQIEIFRINALEPLVDSYYFSEKNRIPAAKELIRKLKIYAKGAKKRGKLELADKYFKKAEYYQEKYVLKIRQ